MDVEQLVAPYERELRSHCYRMLGSVHDADDALQEVRVRAWRGLDGFEGRASARTWLHRIASNVCLTEIDRRARRVLPIDYGPAGPEDGTLSERVLEPVWMEPLPDEPDASVAERESVELAFVAALQHLPGNQRAALILCEVLGFSAAEAAEALGTSAPAINSALQRARASVDGRTPDRSQQATLAALGDAALGKLVERYTGALQAGDVDAVLELLTEDATWSMPPLSSWFTGRAAVTGFLVNGPLTQGWRHRVTTANGQLAIGGYRLVDGVFGAYALDVLDLAPDGRIRAITAFLEPTLFGAFGLPLAADR